MYNTLLSLSDAFDSLYKGQVLVVGLVCDTSHTRRIRSAEDERGETQNVIELIYKTNLKIQYYK